MDLRQLSWDERALVYLAALLILFLCAAIIQYLWRKNSWRMGRVKYICHSLGCGWEGVSPDRRGRELSSCPKCGSGCLTYHS